MEFTTFIKIELITFDSNFIYLRLVFSCESPITISSTFVPPSIPGLSNAWPDVLSGVACVEIKVVTKLHGGTILVQL